MSELPCGGPPDPIDFLRQLTGEGGESNAELIGKLDEALLGSGKTEDDSSEPPKKKRHQDPPARERPAVSYQALQ